MNYNDFLNFLEKSEKQVVDFIMKNHRSIPSCGHKIIDECLITYIERGGKRLRPAVLLMSCGAVGGDLNVALPAASAIELFHTWTLVHDDLIDNDNLRRGKPTIHVAAKELAIQQLNMNETSAKKLAHDIAILIGDLQHGWSISLLTQSLLVDSVSPAVIFDIIQKLQTVVLRTLIHGETVDVELGLMENNITSIDEDKIINMHWMKTGVLYEFAGLFGAMIGKNSIDKNDPQISAIKNFCSNCGIAFQLRDDILGIVGNEKELGKPVGSDIREGKKTTIVRTALINANENQREVIMNILGKKDATESEIELLTKLLIDLQGIERTHQLAQSYIEKAIPYLSELESSSYKKILDQWAYYMIERTY